MRSTRAVVAVHTEPPVDRTAPRLSVGERGTKLASLVVHPHLGLVLGREGFVMLVEVPADAVRGRTWNVAVVGEHAATQFPDEMGDSALAMRVNAVFCIPSGGKLIGAVKYPASEFGDAPDAPCRVGHVWHVPPAACLLVRLLSPFLRIGRPRRASQRRAVGGRQYPTGGPSAWTATNDASTFLTF